MYTEALASAYDRMNWLCYVCSTLLGLKILWNLSVPYDLHWRAVGRSSRPASAGISMMPLVDVVLLAAAVGSAVIGGDDERCRPLAVGVLGMLAVAGSYLHLLLASMLLGWLRRARRPGGTDGP